MQLKTLVKVGEVNNLSDARYCAGMGAEMIGFDITPGGSNALTQEAFKEITEWLEGTNIIGELTDADAGLIEKSLKEFTMHGIQVNTNSDVEALKDYEGIKILKINFSDAPASIAEQIQSHSFFDYYLIDSDYKINLKEEVLSNLKQLKGAEKVILGAGVTLDSIDHVLASTDIAGVHIKGGNEERPGWSDLDELADFLEHLEVEN